MTVQLTRSDLEYLVTARPRAKLTPGFFQDGVFHRLSSWQAYLGTKATGDESVRGYMPDRHGYSTREAALAAARSAQQKFRDMLERGEYVEPDGVS
jgi:hypothetical protein